MEEGLWPFALQPKFLPTRPRNGGASLCIP
jgi:hypothetical protein